jgi:cell division protein FtsQ
MGELYYVDRQGRLFKPLSPGDPHDFPVITGLTRDDFTLDQGHPTIGLTRVFQLLDLLKSTPPPLSLENISEVHVDQERGFTLYANGLNSVVDLGLPEFAEKLDKFARIWPLLVQKGLQTRVTRIQLDYPQRVLLSLAGQEETP